MVVPNCPLGKNYSSLGRQRPRAVTGFTLIELMITLAIIAILATIAAPHFRYLIVKNQITQTTNDLIQALYAARLEAIKRTEPITIAAVPGEPPAINEWGLGLNVYPSSNPAEIIKTISALQVGRTINGPDGTSNFEFLPNGGLSVPTITSNTITFNICDEWTDEEEEAFDFIGRSVTVTARGQIRTAEFDCS